MYRKANMNRTIGIVRGLLSMLVVVGVIAAVVVARVGLPNVAAGASVQPATSGSPQATASAAPSSQTASASAALVHFKGVDIAFDYPSSWNPLPRSAMAVSWIAAFSTGPAPSSCCANYVVPAGTMDVSIAYGSGAMNLASETPASGEVRMAAGNAAAIFSTITSDKATGADLRLTWIIQRTPTEYFDVIALIKGPGTDAFRAQIQALVSTIVVS
jgi:hypothetical protein